MDTKIKRIRVCKRYVYKLSFTGSCSILSRLRVNNDIILYVFEQLKRYDLGVVSILEL